MSPPSKKARVWARPAGGTDVTDARGTTNMADPWPIGALPSVLPVPYGARAPGSGYAAPPDAGPEHDARRQRESVVARDRRPTQAGQKAVAARLNREWAGAPARAHAIEE